MGRFEIPYHHIDIFRGDAAGVFFESVVVEPFDRQEVQRGPSVRIGPLVDEIIRLVFASSDPVCKFEGLQPVPDDRFGVFRGDGFSVQQAEDGRRYDVGAACVNIVVVVIHAGFRIPTILADQFFPGFCFFYPLFGGLFVSEFRSEIGKILFI